MKIHTVYPPYTDEESALRLQLLDLQLAYQKAAEPLNERLAELRMRHLPQYVLEREEGDTVPVHLAQFLQKSG